MKKIWNIFALLGFLLSMGCLAIFILDKFSILTEISFLLLLICLPLALLFSILGRQSSLRKLAIIGMIITIPMLLLYVFAVIILILWGLGPGVQ